MENFYDDFILPDDYEKMAKAYSQSLKKKGFVFIRLQDEECEMLYGEIMIIFAKMLACLKKLEKFLQAELLKTQINKAEKLLNEIFVNKKPHSFNYVANENNAFLCLIGLENLLIAKLTILSIESGELELCNSIITNISRIFAECFINENFSS